MELFKCSVIILVLVFASDTLARPGGASGSAKTKRFSGAHEAHISASSSAASSATFESFLSSTGPGSHNQYTRSGRSPSLPHGSMTHGEANGQANTNINVESKSSASEETPSYASSFHDTHEFLIFTD